jgi:PEP-CTERM motif-containing protein
MKNLLKLSAMAAILVASATYASADTLQLGSYATGGLTMGNNNSAINYAGFSTTVLPLSTGTGSSFFLDPGVPVWNAALPNSTWVGYLATAGPVGTVNPAIGYYTFTTTFTAAGGLYTGTANVMADDTTAVFLNGNLVTPIYSLGGLGGDAHCAQNLPSCQAGDPQSVSVNLLAGLNTLTFLVQQQGVGPTGGSGDPSGFDFDANLSSAVTTTPTPEPSTLLMLGTGLLGSAGALFRRMRK